MNHDLFDDPEQCTLAPGVMLLRGFALAVEQALLNAVAAVVADTPLRQMFTPGGLKMAVALTNCGPLGWVSDAAGYRYQATDPISGRRWHDMPPAFAQLAAQAAAAAGFTGFEPDACLVNRYQADTRLSLHQDRNERDFSQPIVSVSLGLPAIFLLGGLQRSDKTARLPLSHGDVLVWGGPSRLRFHGVLPLAAGHHPLLGAQRINLTLRRAG